MNDDVFREAHWIWTGDERPNDYAAFTRTARLPRPGEPVQVTITASSHYELYINGDFVGRGPVFGDPKWRLYDSLTYTPKSENDSLHVVIVAHNSNGIPILAQRPAPGGVRASFLGGGADFGTDESWKCLPLPMWRQDVPKRGWALDYSEDYDARLEPVGWQEKRFANNILTGWANAVLVPDSEMIWENYQLRPTPGLLHHRIPPVRFTAFRAESPGAEQIGEVSAYCDTEPLTPVAASIEWSEEAITDCLASGANAFTLDLGAEYIGHYAFDIEAPEGTVLDISGAELLRDGRPWIMRKGTRYSVRYHTHAGRQSFHAFGWSGFRYLHIVIRGETKDVTIHFAGCRQRIARLGHGVGLPAGCEGDELLRSIFDLCRHTLRVGAQEHLIDCPSREQAQYWGDALFIAQSLLKGFDEPGYLRWYLDCFLHVPFTPEGQISSVYPGSHAIFPDYSLIPLFGQRFHRENTGAFYRPEETCEKALQLKAWYDALCDPTDGLIRTKPYPIPGDPNIPYVVFIDHPGLGWHDFPHRGIDRNGISGPLNLFYCGWLSLLADLLTSVGRTDEAQAIAAQATRLGDSIRSAFYDGSVFHDARDGDQLSDGASWQVNCLAVFFDLTTGDDARRIMQTMLDRYDTSCRCSPYFHFYFLPALRKVGLEAEAIELIKREWKTMIDGGATTTWEGFEGDEKDSLCHPWSTAPFLHLITTPPAH